MSIINSHLKIENHSCINIVQILNKSQWYLNGFWILLPHLVHFSSIKESLYLVGDILTSISSSIVHFLPASCLVLVLPLKLLVGKSTELASVWCLILVLNLVNLISPSFPEIKSSTTTYFSSLYLSCCLLWFYN